MKKKILIMCFVVFSVLSKGAIMEMYVAGGCFWCVESDLEKVKGVREVISGYSGGKVSNPTYQQVSAGGTGHREAVLIKFDDSIINYSSLLYYFLTKIDPTDLEGQFVDRGYQYSPAIYYQTEEQRKIAEMVLEKIKKDGNFSDINVKVEPFTVFYPAEEYHQDYYRKNPIRYRFYRHRSGRDQFLEKVWK